MEYARDPDRSRGSAFPTRYAPEEMALESPGLEGSDFQDSKWLRQSACPANGRRCRGSDECRRCGGRPVCSVLSGNHLPRRGRSSAPRKFPNGDEDNSEPRIFLPDRDDQRRRGVAWLTTRRWVLECPKGSP